MSEILVVDDPAPRVRRLTLNRPEKRNASATSFAASCTTRSTPPTATRPSA